MILLSMENPGSKLLLLLEIKKLPIKSDEESSLVAGVVLFGLWPCECHLGVLYYLKPILATLPWPFFIPHHLQKQAFDVWEIKNPVHFRTPGFS